jgi:hypothetical protein
MEALMAPVTKIKATERSVPATGFLVEGGYLKGYSEFQK